MDTMFWPTFVLGVVCGFIGAFIAAVIISAIAKTEDTHE